MTLHNILTKIGLKDEEIAVYVAGLRLGPSSARVLAKESGIERVATYSTLNALVEQGLVSKSGSQRKTVFTMEPLESVRHILEARRRELNALEDALQTIQEDQAIEMGSETLSVLFYSGSEGIRTAMNAIVHAKSNFVRSLASVKTALDTVDQSFLQQWFGALDKKGITTKSIWSNEFRNPGFQVSGRNLRLLPEGMNIRASLLTTGSLTLVATGKPHAEAIVIDSAEFTQLINQMHEQIWQQSREL